jgi:glycosyltransferase involved in cell wall biosynthesis
MNKKIAIVAPAQLPIPAIQGGGIEQLIENIINQNEKTPKLTIHVISAYSPLTKGLEKNFLHTQFHNIKYSFFRRCVNYFDREVLSKIFKYQHYSDDVRQIMKYVKKGEYDKVVIFGNDHHIKPISRVVEKERIIFILATLMLKKVKDFSLCNKILVGSNHTKLSILAHNDILIEDEIRVIQSGIDTDYFAPALQNIHRDLIRKKYSIDEDLPLLCYLGRLDASKGVIVLLRAALLLKDIVSFKLILIGSFGLSFGSTRKNKITDEELEIKKYIDELGDKCLVTGFVQKENLIDYLSAVDIGIVPSICEDVSPLTYFQFQSMGIPTIVSDAGGIPEYFSPDYSIIVKRGPDMVTELAESIVKLIQNKSLRDRMAACAIKNREYLGVKRYYDDFVKLVL